MRKSPFLPLLGVLFFTLLPFLVLGSSLDSLKNNLMLIWRTDPEAAIADCKVYQQKAEAADVKAEVAWALNFQGIVFGALGEFDSSFAYYGQSLAYSREHSIPEVEKKTLMNLAINYQYQGRYAEAMTQYFDAIRLFEREQDTMGLAHAYTGMGGVYRFMEEPRKSVAAYWQSLGYYDALGEVSQTGSVWSNLGILYRDLDQRDSAFYCLDTAEVLLEMYENRIGLASLYINKGGLYENSDGPRAGKLYQQALVLGRELGSSRIVALASIGIARQTLLAGNFRKALKPAKEGLEAAREMGDLQYQEEALEILAQASEGAGNTKAAFAYQSELRLISDSILNIERQRSIAELEVQYETEKKEKAIAEQKARLAEKQAELLSKELKVGQLSQWIVIVVSGAVLLAVIAGVFIFFQGEKRRRSEREAAHARALEREKREREVGEEKLRISRELHDNIGSQITFLVSSLDNMKYYTDAPMVAQKLDQLSGFGRDAISDLRHAIWALKADAKLSDVVLKVRQLTQRLSDTLPAKIVVEEEVLADRALNSVEAINLLRIVQESLQNAAKYAEAQLIRVRFQADSDELKLEVIDDGKGFAVDALPPDAGEGLGNMRARAKAMGAHLEIVSRANAGTQVIFRKRFVEEG